MVLEAILDPRVFILEPDQNSRRATMSRDDDLPLTRELEVA